MPQFTCPGPAERAKTGGRPYRLGPKDQRGSVTAEFALALPAVVLTLLLVLGMALHGAAAVAVEEASRAGARELARGTEESVAANIAAQAAGADAAVAISYQPPYAVMTVTRPVTVLGAFALPFEHTAEAHVRTEHLP